VASDFVESAWSGILHRDALIVFGSKHWSPGLPSHKAEFRKCAAFTNRFPRWHVPELAKGVSDKPRPSQAQGRATQASKPGK